MVSSTHSSERFATSCHLGIPLKFVCIPVGDKKLTNTSNLHGPQIVIPLQKTIIINHSTLYLVFIVQHSPHQNWTECDTCNMHCVRILLASRTLKSVSFQFMSITPPSVCPTIIRTMSRKMRNLRTPPDDNRITHSIGHQDLVSSSKWRATHGSPASAKDSYCSYEKLTWRHLNMGWIQAGPKSV